MSQLVKTERLPNGNFKRIIKGPLGDEESKFFCIRFALVWPTPTSPGYFIGAGEEAYDEKYYAPADGRGIIKVLAEYEHKDLSLDSFFSVLTDQMISNLAECCYCDVKQKESNNDFRSSLYNYLDRKNLRNISIEKAPFDDFVLRVGIVTSWDERGSLVIEKNTPLYSELKGISRADLSDPNVEAKFFRLNCLSYLLSGFEKYKPTKPLKGFDKNYGGREQWML